MTQTENNSAEQKEKKTFFHAKGVTYFDKKVERNFFFILTLAMLICGILFKMGWIGH